MSNRKKWFLSAAWMVAVIAAGVAMLVAAVTHAALP